MRVLFIEAPYSYGTASLLVGDYFPLGIGYLAAYIRGFGHTVRIFQPPENGNFDSAILQELDSFKPEVVGISVMTSSYPEAVRLCGIIKSKRSCHTVLGGHHVSAMGVDILAQSPHTDFTVIGEGELTLNELMEALKNGSSDFSTIDGLTWRDSEGTIHLNKPRKIIENIDVIPYPARDLVDMNRFRLHSYIEFGKKSATMITSRGCPFKCIFCSSWLTMGSRYRWRSAEKVLDEIKELVEVHGVDHIVFEDDTITLRRDRMLEICEGLMEMPKRPSWYCLSRVDTMDYELACRMKAAGCRMVNFGIESGSPEILKHIGKRINIEKASEAVAACTKAGLRTQCTFIVGFPFDTDETMEQTLSLAKKINPTIAIFFPLTPYPGTKIFNEFMDQSLIPETVKEWKTFNVTNSTAPISVNPKYTGEEIRRRSQLWNRRYYLRPAQWIRMLRTVKSPVEIIRLAQGGIYMLSTWIKG